MYPVVKAYLAVGRSQRAFCAEKGLPISVLRYPLRRYREESDAGFVQVQPEAAPTEKAHVEMLYPGGTRIRLFSPVTPAYVAALVGGSP